MKNIKIPNFTFKEWDKTFQKIPGWDTEAVRAAKVMVVGSGALGNEVLKNLALLNVGNILVIDFDTIEYSNLSRSILFRESDCGNQSLKVDVASKRIKEINKNVKVKTINGDVTADVGLGIFRRVDVVVGCLDNRLARLFLNRACHKVDKIWVDGAIENLAGQVNVYKPDTSCYECQLSEVERANIRYRLGCPDIAQRNATQGRIPTTPISSSIVAALQTQEALKVVMGNERQSMAGEKFYFEGMNNIFLQYNTPDLKEDCLSHYRYDSILEAPNLTAQMTVKETLDFLSQHFKTDHPIIELDYELVLEITGKQSEKTSAVVVPFPHLSDQLMQKYEGVTGENMVITKDLARIDKTFPHLDMTLQSIGIPPLHIMSVLIDSQRHFVELTGDEPYFSFT